MIPAWKLSGRLGNQMFQLAYLYSQSAKGIIPDIYLQSEEHFVEIAEQIKSIFKQDIVESDMVAIHVRRGDYVNNPFYVDLMETDYYAKAMAMFPDRDFIVFSDNIEWCKGKEIFKNCEFSEGKTDVEDLNLIAGCNGVIMANSSFSWWGAYLSRGKVIAPKDWYRDGIERTKLLETWTRL